MHLASLMCSWAVVCDVWYLEPQTQRPGESAIDFSNRVKKLIAETARIEDVQWDGYMKYFKPSARFVQSRQKVYAEGLLQRLKPTLDAAAAAAVASAASLLTTPSAAASVAVNAPATPAQS
jgi:glycerol-3-phosphate O-acyltransferase 3/4